MPRKTIAKAAGANAPLSGGGGDLKDD